MGQSKKIGDEKEYWQQKEERRKLYYPGRKDGVERKWERYIKTLEFTWLLLRIWADHKTHQIQGHSIVWLVDIDSAYDFGN